MEKRLNRILFYIFIGIVIVSLISNFYEFILINLFGKLTLLEPNKSILILETIIAFMGIILAIIFIPKLIGKGRI